MGRRRRANGDSTNGAIPWASVTTSIGKHIRKAIGTKGVARKELTAIRANIDGRTFVPPREDSFDGLVDE